MRLLALAALAHGPGAFADAGVQQGVVEPVAAVPLDGDGRERYDAGWSLYLDNDALTMVNRDQDYTGGIALTLAGRRAQDGWVSIDRPLGAIDALLGVEAGARLALHNLQIGSIAFTPENRPASKPAPGDRPYANLLYLANARNYLRGAQAPVYQTTLTVGLLGLGAAREMQNAVHDVLGVDSAHGWSGQISDGGEPTLRYTLARQDLLLSSVDADSEGLEIESSFAGSVGYITDASVALSLRWGRINTPPWSFPPEQVDYIAEPVPAVGGIRPGVRELYVWAGARARLRAYNVFLQGQFRDNRLEYDADEVRPLIGEAWAGVTAQVSEHFHLSWVLRYQSSELRSGRGDRELLWGSLYISRDI